MKAQIQYNTLRSQQSPFSHLYKSIEKGATYEDSNRNYVVKAVTVPSSESSNSKNIVDSVKDFMGTSAAISASLIAVEKVSDISPLFFMGLLQAVLPHLFMDLYVNGVNQLFDFEIDKRSFITKPSMSTFSTNLPRLFGNPVNLVRLVTYSTILSTYSSELSDAPPS
ncbi:hypothetical protein V8G54_030212 [Vigna mungo]|uniref:Uncharacterized protein n=1 Tax=Vigna mungo TaxID=3915 RepID=A0AAQ3MVY2_VIGMU